MPEGTMNAPELLYLLREPAARPRTLADLAADTTAIAIELTSADASVPYLTLDEAQAKLLHAARLLEEAHEAMHAHKLSELEQLCAHCGHDRGEHLVDGAQACEHECDDEGDAPCSWGPCQCDGYVAPGQFAADGHPTDRVADTERPPAP
jgi:hypothetical protein